MNFKCEEAEEITVSLEDIDEAIDIGAPDRLRARLDDIGQGRRS